MSNFVDHFVLFCISGTTSICYWTCWLILGLVCIHTYIYIYSYSGWWFGTFFIFPYIGLLIIPIDEIIFFRGVAQPPTSIAYVTHTSVSSHQKTTGISPEAATLGRFGCADRSQLDLSGSMVAAALHVPNGIRSWDMGVS